MDWSPGYREQAPPAALARSVACLWANVATDGRPGASGPPVVLVLPDACVDVIWQRGTGVFVAGPDTRPVPAEFPAGTVLAGVRFAPGAAGPALGLPLRGLLNQRIGAEDLGSPAWRLLARRADGSLPPAEALRELIAAVSAMTGRGEGDRMVAAAARRLGRPGAVVAEVAADLGVSERQLRRRCEAAVGYGLATLRRVLRFRRFVDWVDGLAGGPASTSPQPPPAPVTPTRPTCPATAPSSPA